VSEIPKKAYFAGQGSEKNCWLEFDLLARVLFDG